MKLQRHPLRRQDLRVRRLSISSTSAIRKAATNLSVPSSSVAKISLWPAPETSSTTATKSIRFCPGPSRSPIWATTIRRPSPSPRTELEQASIKPQFSYQQVEAPSANDAGEHRNRQGTTLVVPTTIQNKRGL